MDSSQYWTSIYYKEECLLADRHRNGLLGTRQWLGWFSILKLRFHTDSVWALFTFHPYLEIFYAGDESDFVAKVDIVENSSDPEGTLVC